MALRNRYRLAWGACLLFLSITACESADPHHPSVSSTVPAAQARNVHLNRAVTATFSEAMEPASFSASTFSVSGATGTVSYTGTTATFTPSGNLQANTTYIATIARGVADLKGNQLKDTYTWTFRTGTTTDQTAPTVTATVPAANETGVALNRAITATFSEPMLASSLTQATFTITGVAGTVSTFGTTAVFTPTGNLSPNTAYTATITTGATDLAGNALAAAFVWTFTTGASSDQTAPTVTATVPAAGATGVRLSAPITVTFSEPMQPGTITTGTFTVVGATGTVASSATTATFTPTSNLLPNYTYQATITTGTTDLAGVPLAGPVTWSFTTGATASISVLYSFAGTTGADPKGSLTLVTVSSTPTLFGRTAFGGTGWSASNPNNSPGGGVIFSLPIGSSSATTYSFTSSASLPTSGYQPHHDAMTLVGSMLYGTALFTGTISFNGTGNGTIFQYNPSLTAPACSSSVSTPYCAVYNFAGSAGSGPDGANAHSAFGVGMNNQVLYGATAQGGTNGDGTLYALSLAANPPTYLGALVSLNNTTTGKDPHGKPIVISNGTQDVLLGMTKAGGASGVGAIYACLPNSNTAPTACTYTRLKSFAGPPSDGATTDHGNLTVTATTATTSVTVYGMTTNGGTGTKSGSAGDGVMFLLGNVPINPPAPLAASLPVCANAGAAACYSILHNFGGTNNVVNLQTGELMNDGYNPFGSLLYVNNYFYGMTRNGGANDQGVIFRMSQDGTAYGILASFDGNSGNATGNQPIDNVIASSDGSTLYGMTQQGGANDINSQQTVGFGTVFSIQSTP